RRWRPFWIFSAAGGALLALTLAIWMWPGLPARHTSGLIVPLVSGAAAAMAAMALIWLARHPRWFKRGLVAAGAILAVAIVGESRLYHGATHSEWGETSYMSGGAPGSPVFAALQTLRL